MKNFEYYKTRALKEFEKAKKLKLIDKKILPLLEEINKKENYYTTSSCSGRITIDINFSKKKNHLWLLKTHKTINENDLKKTLEIIKKYNLKNVFLKVDSFILHIGCKDLESANKFLDLCKNIGLKRTGIIQIEPRIIIEIVGLDKIEMPIFVNNLVINKENIDEIVKTVNEKLIKNWKRIFQLAIKLKEL